MNLSWILILWMSFCERYFISAFELCNFLMQEKNIQLMGLLLFLAKIYVQIPRLPVGLYVSILNYFCSIYDWIYNVHLKDALLVKRTISDLFFVYNYLTDWVLPPIWCSTGIFDGARASWALCKDKGSHWVPDRWCMHIFSKFIVTNLHFYAVFVYNFSRLNKCKIWFELQRFG